MIIFWIYKIINHIKKTPLNNGERYDPNILKKFGIEDPHQAARYHFAKTITKNKSVIDIACGTGYGSAILADEANSVIGVDISPISIAYANKHYKKEKINFIIDDFFSCQQKADVAISFETIEHLKSDLNKTVNHLLLLANELVICSVPYEEEAGHNRHHFHFKINENNFNFLNNKYKYYFLYQTPDGDINAEKKGDTVSLILIIQKANTSVIS